MQKTKIFFFILFLIVCLFYLNHVITGQTPDKLETHTQETHDDISHTARIVINFFQKLNIPKQLIIFIISTLPTIELRGSIPVGIFLLNMKWVPVIFYSLLGNIGIVIPILLFLDPIEKVLRRISIFNVFFDWLFKRTRRKSKLIETYEELGLILFVAIPLPLTGAITGSIAAYIFGIPFWKAFIMIIIGVLIACTFVSGVVLVGKIFGLGIIVALLLVIFIAAITIYLKNKYQQKNTANK